MCQPAYLVIGLVIAATSASVFAEPIVQTLFAHTLATSVVEPAVRACPHGHAALLALLLTHAFAVVHDCAIRGLRGLGGDDRFPRLRYCCFALQLPCLGYRIVKVGQDGFLQDGGVCSRTQANTRATLNLWTKKRLEIFYFLNVLHFSNLPASVPDTRSTTCNMSSLWPPARNRRT